MTFILFLFLLAVLFIPAQSGEKWTVKNYLWKGFTQAAQHLNNYYEPLDELKYT